MEGSSPRLQGRPAHLARRPAQPLVATVINPGLITPAATHEVLNRLIQQALQLDAALIDASGLCDRDSDAPSVQFWRLILQALKPGGYLLAFGDSRSYHRMVVKVEDAGFEVRDQIIWLAGSVMEPAVLARKPLSEPTVAANIMAHGTGALNTKECRIEVAGSTEKRWPSNLVIGEDTRALLGTSARFYYTVAADADIPRGSTTKPKTLIKYLCRLITPPGGVVLNFLAGLAPSLLQSGKEPGQAEWNVASH